MLELLLSSWLNIKKGLINPEIEERVTSVVKSIFQILSESKKLLTSKGSILTTWFSSLAVWISLNSWNAIESDNFWFSFAPFIVPLIVSPIGQLTNHFRNKNHNRSIRETLPDKNPFFVLQINKETWIVEVSNTSIRTWIECPLNEWDQIDGNMHEKILEHYYRWNKRFELKHEWKVYLFAFWDNEEDWDSDSISLFWVDITESIIHKNAPLENPFPVMITNSSWEILLSNDANNIILNHFWLNKWDTLDKNSALFEYITKTNQEWYYIEEIQIWDFWFLIHARKTPRWEINFYWADITKIKNSAEIFRKFVPSHIVEEILDWEFEPTLEEKKVTILFSDIRNYTSLSEQLSHAAMADFLNYYFNLISPIIKKYSWTIDKFIWDAVMVTFDWEDSAWNAIRTSVEIQQIIDKNRGTIAEILWLEIEDEFNVWIWLHTWSVTMWCIWSNIRLNFTVIWDTVNLAARLETETKNHKGVSILASRKTAEQWVLSLNLIWLNMQSKWITTVKWKKDEVEVIAIKYDLAA